MKASIKNISKRLSRSGVAILFVPEKMGALRGTSLAAFISICGKRGLCYQQACFISHTGCTGPLRIADNTPAQERSFVVHLFFCWHLRINIGGIFHEFEVFFDALLTQTCDHGCAVTMICFDWESLLMHMQFWTVCPGRKNKRAHETLVARLF